MKKVERYIEKAASSSKPVDVTSLCYWFAFDVMGEFAFAKSFGMLDNERYHNVILLLRRAMRLLGPFSPVLWLARLGFALFPRIWRIADWNDMMAYCRNMMSQRIQVSRKMITGDHKGSYSADQSCKPRYLNVPHQGCCEESLHRDGSKVSQR